MNITKKQRTRIEKIMKERFPGKVHYVEMEPWVDSDGDDALLVQIYMDKSTTEKDMSGKMYGLHGIVREVMGDAMSDRYPFIRLREAPDRCEQKSRLTPPPMDGLTPGIRAFMQIRSGESAKSPPMNITKKQRTKIEKIMKERFPGKVHYVEMEPWVDSDGDDALLVQIYMDKSTTEKDVSGKMYGLHGIVREVMGDAMSDRYPFIRLREARG